METRLPAFRYCGPLRPTTVVAASQTKVRSACLPRTVRLFAAASTATTEPSAVRRAGWLAAGGAAAARTAVPLAVATRRNEERRSCGIRMSEPPEGRAVGWASARGPAFPSQGVAAPGLRDRGRRSPQPPTRDLAAINPSTPAA